MKKRRLLVSLLFGLMLAFPAVSGAGSGEVVAVEDNRFDPDRVNLVVNTSMMAWKWAPKVENPHNVRQDDKLFYSGAPKRSGQFTREFSAGSFPYFCEVHPVAMDGVITAKPVLDEKSDPPGPAVRVAWANAFTNTGDEFDVEFRVNDGDWRPFKTNTSKFSAAFGVDDNPVPIVAGREYRFRARSQRSANPDRRSGWSPRLLYPVHG